MTTLALVTALTVLALLACLQVLVAAGRPHGRFVWGGAHRVLPTRLRFGSAISIVLYGAFATLLLSRAGLLPGSDNLAEVVATWVLFGYFSLGILANAISLSTSERWAMVPASVLLAVSTLAIATE